MTEEIKEMLWKIKRQNTYDDIGYFKTPLSNDDADKLLNYITNLQNENEKIKMRNDMLRKDIDSFIKDNKTDYKSRNEKAIEYIEKYLHEHVIDDLPDEESKFELENGTPIPNAKEVLLNILKGED